jgi:dihydroflavonol-4-reductase
MNALVTGAAGFLGSHIARLPLQGGEEVRVLLRPSSETRALPGWRWTGFRAICGSRHR